MNEAKQNEVCTVTAFDGRIVVLNHFEGFDMEDHPGIEGDFRVRAHRPLTASLHQPVTLYEGSMDDCKKYVREVLAPKLDIDVDDASFKDAYGASRKKAS